MPALRLTLLLAAVLASAPAALLPEALEPAASGGLEAVDRALARLSIHARLLVIGAHPDDEDNSLLTWVSRGLGGEAAYLSLSRGEGGQNLIGPELGESLGLIRTGELLAARHIEGTRQYFARAYDFGYTRSLEETFERWPRELLLEDAIRAVRRFKPQVLVAIFPADRRAGHGQHQASAVIAADVFERAGELGLPAGSLSALYRRAWSREDATLAFALGALDPLSGRSLGQISAASRSSHRSQDMGREQLLGDFRGGLRWIAGGAGEAGADPFAGIDTRLAALAASANGGEEVAARLERVENLARAARGRLSPTELEAAAATFVRILEELRAAAALTEDGAVRELLDEKIAVAETGLAAAAGVVVDALADREAVPFGGEVEVTTTVWVTGGLPVEVAEVTLRSSRGWSAELGEPVAEGDSAPGLESRRHRLTAPTDPDAAVPYFLAKPRAGDLYDWSGVAEAVRGEPFEPGVVARFALRIAGAEVELEREVVHRFADQALGEVRRPLRPVPPVEVEVEPELAFWPIGGAVEDVGLDVTLTSNLESEVEARLHLEAPEGWPAVEALPVTLAPGGREVEAYRLHPPAAVEPGRYTLRATLALPGGEAVASSHPVLDYPHVRPFAYREPAVTRVHALSIRLPRLDRVGYVRGASDRVPELLQKIGLPVEVLDLARLDHGDLAAFDAVVIGSRAYEIDSSLRRMNGALLRYVEQGGTLIVQYQQYQFVSGGFSPLALTIGRPHGRITDETSPVTVLEPGHPALTHPNAIGDADWQGWVQERGLYFAEEWDEAFVPLLALRDPGGQPEQRGSLLVAGYGEGTYVYTGLSFFRELPAGVPGAFRLFANLLALGEK